MLGQMHTSGSAQMKHPPPSPFFSGLEYLDAAIVAVRKNGEVAYFNPAAADLLGLKDEELGLTLSACLAPESPLVQAVVTALGDNISITEHELLMLTAHGEVYVSLCATPIESEHADALLEVRQIDQQRRIANEERLQAQQQANRELIRNLAHEIKNPLGGIRGAAQLLSAELADAQLKEYTQVIIEESQRLQGLLDRLLTPHRLPKLSELSIHEVLERVRSLVLAETPNGLAVRRDYDTSLPGLIGDREQLIQATLNVVRNAVQAMSGIGEVILKTRITRQATLNRKRFPLAIMVQIIDNGPGIPEALKETLFYPLVSGRPGGTGIGLHLAHTYISQHHGAIEFDSRPGYTCFTIMLPLNGWQTQTASEKA
ncbi:two-component system, NtrC family, nitrogen regulation sensor histidine kinase GlnL [Andreprevotia lacus DSM 23236]|uniref:Sensory histidine kinase/phosphatase NtrB n=2 Tax=Andreprevotia TaxID=397275 RepID=A0A1W1X265_9NEIS|nr:two-component system, NtrC family, nitrogen regulation sensor histidine kinase GlnL [Andreprevotia lacus DSM 23236]